MLQYDPQTKTLTVAHRDFRIADVYIDDGVYCLVPKDPAEQVFITNGKRLIRAHNFSIGRGLFIRYVREGGNPKYFVSQLNTVMNADDAVATFLLITGSCTDGLVEWRAHNGAYNMELTVQEWLDKIATIEYLDGGAYSKIVTDYYTTKDDYSNYTPYTTVIPGMEPHTADTEDYTGVE